jgi:hypothetical protein
MTMKLLRTTGLLVSGYAATGTAMVLLSRHTALRSAVDNAEKARRVGHPAFHDHTPGRRR